ncbi:hypothetical protein SIO70_15645 [Chitinophaga sancti]|uniref:hypothetical protein n=1 Tax=Chitinophaga sancti TaxID=1004 RepID=UPI002A752907|nr:hypothetical protein [Chitinophaga sancti]WPQ66294.1 hypothetical protein SIO70_15645 [Chitinophaga sancti]
MLQHFEVIQHILKETFEIDKMKSDLIEYLSLKEDGLNLIKVGAKYEVWAYNNSLQKKEPYIVSPNEKLTIYTYRVVDDLQAGFQCHVYIAIGNYQKVDHLFTTDKCIAIFKYDGELNLAEIEFFMEEIYKP